MKFIKLCVAILTVTILPMLYVNCSGFDAAQIASLSSSSASEGVPDTGDDTDNDGGGASLRPKVDLTKVPAPEINPAKIYNDERVTASNQSVNSTVASGAFRNACYTSHYLQDDPVRYPNQPGKAPLNIFFGNTDANANSTADSIVKTGNSSCAGGTLNRGAFWSSTIILPNGTPFAPTSSLFYYKTAIGDVVNPIPQGLVMLAGDPNRAVANAGISRFNCYAVSGTNITFRSSDSSGWDNHLPTNCQNGDTLVQEVHFPRCWDGINLDSSDHISHMAEVGGNGKCPAAFPVLFPQVSYELQYSIQNLSESDRKGWRLSSDNYSKDLPPGLSSSGGYIAAWNDDIMQTFIQYCDNAPADCHGYLLGDGRTLY